MSEVKILPDMEVCAVRFKCILKGSLNYIVAVMLLTDAFYVCFIRKTTLIEPVTESGMSITLRGPLTQG